MRSYWEYLYDDKVRNNSLHWEDFGKVEYYNISHEKIAENNELQDEIISLSNGEVLKYISDFIDISKYYKHILFLTSDKTFASSVDFTNVRSIINFKTVNEITHLNKHLSSVNKLLPDKGIFIGRVETYGERKNRIFKKFGSRFGQLLWLLDFIINRVIPKIRPVDKIYKFVTRDKIHPISKAEILGRLIYCGFDIIDYSIIDNLFYFVVRKNCEPCIEEEPSYHAIVRLKRVGKNGKIIKVFKFRTMHAYSEFLQDYVIRLYEYNDGGKPSDNFRISRWGKLLRKFWIDEIPQLINVLKGEMKLVGVRPVSRVRFNQFPKDLQNERIKYKPGCFPPYVALLKPDQFGNIKAERIYLNDFKQSPFLTDLRYLLKSVFNIVMSKIRGL
jgi:lipopolysaccharide/colanic/teichoic acid biosynthesis glycosyltransferase